MSTAKPTYQELEKRLERAESIVNALRDHEVDAVVGEEKIAFLLVREVEEALRISDAGYRAMFELSGIGMIEAESPAFRLTRVNQRFCELLGYSADECLTKTYIGFTDPKDRRRAMRELAKVLRGNANSWSIEKHCVRKDGSPILVAIDGAALRDHAGQVVKIVAMVQDLTTTEAGRRDLLATKALAEQGKLPNRKKTAVKHIQKVVRAKSAKRPPRKIG